MRTIITLFAALAAGTAFAQTPPAGVEIGPWKIEVSFTGAGVFDRCIMSRTTNEGIEARVTRDDSGLTLVLSSPRWALDAGATYNVEFAADAWLWTSPVIATANSVSVALTDTTFNEGLRLANTLEVRGAGATIRVPLNSSSAALARLDSCYERNDQAGVANPFVAPVRTP